jgi:dTMP kinase
LPSPKADQTGATVAQRTIDGGFFITFEGPEGAGKSTQVERLARVLDQRGYRVCLTREPGGTQLGERLRDLIMHFDGPEEITPESEVLMFGASRAQLMRTVILPHLARGGIVLCDRFADSTTAYQGLARRLDRAFIEAMHRFTVGDRWPDLTFLLDLEVDAGLSRARRRQRAAAPCHDRIGAESRDFHQAVREGFLDLARAEPGRFRIVDATADQDTVHARILEEVDRALG